MIPVLIGFGAAMIFGGLLDSKVTLDEKPQKQVEFQFPRAVTKDALAGGAVPMQVDVRPYAEFKYENINRQVYDFSCGSGALVTLINSYLGMNVTEQAAMEGMMAHGEKEKIIERRGFSMLDMKRYVLTLGAVATGYRGTLQDLAIFVNLRSCRSLTVAASTLWWCAGFEMARYSSPTLRLVTSCFLTSSLKNGGRTTRSCCTQFAARPG